MIPDIWSSQDITMPHRMVRDLMAVKSDLGRLAAVSAAISSGSWNLTVLCLRHAQDSTAMVCAVRCDSRAAVNSLWLWAASWGVAQ